MGVIDTATNIGICNQSLGLLGAKQIVINTTSTNRTLCELFWADARDEILSAHPWNFAVKLANTIETTAPLGKYDHAFTVPSDCLRVLTVDEDPAVQWQRWGSTIVTNVSETPATYSDDEEDYVAGQYITVDDVTYLVDTAFTSSDETTDLASYCTSQSGDYAYLPVEYIWQVTDLSTYPSYAKKCVVLNLAIMLAPPIKQDGKMAMDIQGMLYGSKKSTGFLSLAQSLDAQEAGGTVIKTDTWLNSRNS